MLLLEITTYFDSGWYTLQSDDTYLHIERLGNFYSIEKTIIIFKLQKRKR